MWSGFELKREPKDDEEEKRNSKHDDDSEKLWSDSENEDDMENIVTYIDHDASQDQTEYNLNISSLIIDIN